MQPQPPPDIAAPPASEHAIRSRRIRNAIWTCGIISVIFSLWYLLDSMTSHRRGPHYQSEAVNNARQIGIALFGFETEFGSFPDASTDATVQAETGTDLDLGRKSSNDFFRQLISTSIAQSEPMFYAKINGTKKPDGIFTKGEAIKKGECGFTYFLGAKTTDNPSRPLLVTPMIPGTDRFDPKPFKGKAVVLKLDQSVTSLPINKDGHLMINGRNLTESNHPIWDGHPPVIAWPDLK